MGNYQIVIVTEQGDISGRTFESVFNALSYFSNVHHLIETSEIVAVDEYYFKVKNYTMVIHFTPCAVYFPERNRLEFYDCTFEEGYYKGRLNREKLDEPFYVYDLVADKFVKYQEKG